MRPRLATEMGSLDIQEDDETEVYRTGGRVQTRSSSPSSSTSRGRSHSVPMSRHDDESVLMHSSHLTYATMVDHGPPMKFSKSYLRWCSLVHFLFFTLRLRLWVMFAFLTYQVGFIAVMLNWMVLCVGVLGFWNEQNASASAVVSSIGLCLVALTATPHFLYDFNQLRVDSWRSASRWFRHYHREVLLPIAEWKPMATRFPRLVMWLRTLQSLRDVLIVSTFFIPLTAALFACIFYYNSMTVLMYTFLASAWVLDLFLFFFVYFLYMAIERFTRNDFAWFRFFWRVYSGKHREVVDCSLSTVRNRLVMASVWFMLLLLCSLFSTVDIFVRVGVWQGFMVVLFLQMSLSTVSLQMQAWINLHGENPIEEHKYQERMERREAQVKAHAMEDGLDAWTETDLRRMLRRIRDTGRVPADIQPGALEKVHFSDVRHSDHIREPHGSHELLRPTSGRCVGLRRFWFNYFSVYGIFSFFGMLVFFSVLLTLALPVSQQPTVPLPDIEPGKPVFGQPLVGNADRAAYPICDMRWHDLSVVDMVLFARLAFDRSYHFFPYYFNDTEWSMERHGNFHEASFTYFRNDVLNVSVVSVPGTQSIKGSFIDLSLYADVFLIQMIPFIPLVHAVASSLITLFVNFAHFPTYVLYPSEQSEFYGQARTFTKELVANGEEVYITGTSLGGMVAKVIGATVHRPAIAFAGPGLGWSVGKFGISLDDLRDTAVNINAEYDIIHHAGLQQGLVQNVDCLYPNLGQCHQPMSYACILYESCGDLEGRSYVEQECKDVVDQFGKK